MLTKDDILKGQFSVNGSPWIKVTANSSIDVDTLSLSIDGSPWWGVEDAGAPPSGQIKNWDSAPIASWKTIYGVPIAQVKAINGVLV